MKKFINDASPIAYMALNLLENVKHWKNIELFFTKNRCGNIHEIANALGVHWVTAQKEIKKLEDLGRIHREGKIYFLNGINKWQKRIDLNDKHSLFIDTFRTHFGDNFIRIKETKKENGDWHNVGNIMITKDKIKDVRAFLKIVETSLKSLS